MIEFVQNVTHFENIILKARCNTGSLNNNNNNIFTLRLLIVLFTKNKNKSVYRNGKLIRVI